MKSIVEVDLKWFHFSQNNSGGSFVVNDFVCEDIFIQARSAREAIDVADVFCDNSDSCPCCGDRWSLYYVEDDDGHDVPTLYDEPLDQVKDKGWYREQARLHFFDGKIKTYVYGDPPCW